jgi:hypothetical protein
MTVNFGDQYKLVISPGHILWLSDYLEKWLIMLSQGGQFDSYRECTMRAQTIISEIADRSELIAKSKVALVDHNDSSADQTPVDDEPH